MKVQNEIDVYELNNEEVKPTQDVKIHIESHWNRTSMVVIRVGENRYAVVADHVLRAISNATNHD